MTPKHAKPQQQKPAVGNETGQISPNTGKVNEAPVAPAVPAVAPTKQAAAINQLTDGWKAKGVDLGKLTQTQDCKFVNLVVADGWPVVAVGPTGGINLPQIRSYSKPFDAAMDGKTLLEKQSARDAKKSAAPAPATATVAAAKSEQAKDPAPTPAQRKKVADAQLEQKLQQAQA